MRVSVGVFEHTFFVRSKIAVVQFFERERQQPLVFFLCRQFLERFFKREREFPLYRLALLIVRAVVRNPINEKQAQYFYAFALEGNFLVEVTANRIADLHTPKIIADAAQFLPQGERLAVVELDEFIARFAVDFRYEIAVAVNLAFL